jgi:hypothetical protein
MATEEPPALSEWASTEERAAYVNCERIVAAFASKGLTAFYGPLWDGACDYHDRQPFLYCHPLSNGDVGIYAGYDGGTYDQYFLKAHDVDMFLSRLTSHNGTPSRSEVWNMVEVAQ